MTNILQTLSGLSTARLNNSVNLTTGPTSLLQANTSSTGAIRLLTSNNTTTTSIDSILRQSEVNARKNQIYASALLRLNAIREGNFKPIEEWDELGGAYQLAGQPFTLFIDDKGAIKVSPQATDELADFPVTQRKSIRNAVSELEELISVESLLRTRKNLRNELTAASVRVLQLQDVTFAATSVFDAGVKTLLTSDTPFTIGLDSDGKRTIVNQNLFEFPDKSQYEAIRLQQVVQAYNAYKSDTSADLSNYSAYDNADTLKSLAETATTYAGQGYGFFFDINKTTNQLEVKRVISRNIMPDFLDEKLDKPASSSKKHLSDALDFYREGKPFRFSFMGGVLQARELTIAELSGATSANYGQSQYSQSIVSLLA